MPLNAQDRAPYRPSPVGLSELRKTYDAAFAAMRLTVKGNVAEIIAMTRNGCLHEPTEGHYAYSPTGKTSREANQELINFHKERDGKFKIARYSFSTRQKGLRGLLSHQAHQLSPA